MSSYCNPIICASDFQYAVAARAEKSLAFPVPLRVHLFARRTSLILSVKGMATIFKVWEFTYKTGEGEEATPSVKRFAFIIRFLTYSPYDPELPLGDRLVLSHSFNGITQKKLARLRETDQSTLAPWER
jgi:hypothetical protein